jgi:two-component system nitrate/nitrite response regulator NarL
MRPTSHVRIIVADGHPIFRLGVRTLLAQQPDFEVIGEAADTASALELARSLRPDILMIDHSPPRMDCLEVLRQLKATPSATRAVVIPASIPERDIQKALGYGAWGVIPKRTASEVLLRCIRHVMRGEQWIGVESVDALVGWLQSPPASGASSLTQREIQIVRHVARGASNKDVAAQLKMGEQTVKNHLRRIFRKLRVTNRVELALLALEQGGVPPDGHGAT